MDTFLNTFVLCDLFLCSVLHLYPSTYPLCLSFYLLSIFYFSVVYLSLKVWRHQPGPQHHLPWGHRHSQHSQHARRLQPLGWKQKEEGQPKGGQEGPRQEDDGAGPKGAHVCGPRYCVSIPNVYLLEKDANTSPWSLFTCLFIRW